MLNNIYYNVIYWYIQGNIYKVIYYNDSDTIFDFMKNQQNNWKGIINTDLKLDVTYKDYF